MPIVTLLIAAAAASAGAAAVAGAAEADVTLSDDKGRKVFIPAGSLAYVEVGEASPRRVGFGV